MGVSNVMDTTGRRTPATVTVRFRRGVSIWAGKNATEYLSWCNGPHSLPADIAYGLIAQHRADPVDAGTPKDDGKDHRKERQRVGIDPTPEEHDPALPIEQRDPQNFQTRQRR